MSRFQLGENFIYYTLADKDFTDGMDRTTFVEAIRHAVTVRFGWPKYVSNAMIQVYTSWENVTDPIENLKNYIEVY